MNGKMKSLACVLAALLTVGPALALAQATPELRRTQTNPNRGPKNRSQLLGIPVNGKVIAKMPGTIFANVPLNAPIKGTLDIMSFRQLAGTQPDEPFMGHYRDPNYVPQIAAVGVFTGTVDGQPVSSFIEFPITYAGGVGACDILNLVLGPLDLNILGLVIQLDQVVLDIFAVPGAGNLLGNLLCAIVGIFDTAGALANLVALLTTLAQLLALFG